MYWLTDYRSPGRSRLEQPCVLVVTSQADAVQALRQPADQRRPALRVEWARDAHLALDMALRLEPRLVLIDSQMDADSSQRLRRHLARVLPEATCYLCQPSHQPHGADTAPAAQPAPRANATHNLHWDELPQLLRHWTPRCHALQAA